MFGRLASFVDDWANDGDAEFVPRKRDSGINLAAKFGCVIQIVCFKINLDRVCLDRVCLAKESLEYRLCQQSCE